MENIEILKCLIRGINPFTGEICEKDSILNDSNVIRALFEICDELQNRKIRKNNKTGFSLANITIDESVLPDRQISISEILRIISKQLPENMNRPTFSQVSTVLINRNLMAEEIKDGKKHKYATEQASSFGITNQHRVSSTGVHYDVVVFDRNGQLYVLDILKNIGKEDEIII